LSKSADQGLGYTGYFHCLGINPEYGLCCPTTVLHQRTKALTSTRFQGYNCTSLMILWLSISKILVLCCRHGRSFLDHLDLEHAIDEAEEVYQQQQQAREAAVAAASAAASARRAEDQREQLQHARSLRQQEESSVDSTAAAESPALQIEAALDESSHQQQQQQQQASNGHADHQTSDPGLSYRQNGSHSDGAAPPELPYKHNGSQHSHQQPSLPTSHALSSDSASAAPAAAAAGSTTRSSASDDSSLSHASSSSSPSTESSSATSPHTTSSSSVSTHGKGTSPLSPQEHPSTSGSHQDPFRHGPPGGASQPGPQQGFAPTSPQPHWADLKTVYFAVNEDGEPMNCLIPQDTGQQGDMQQCAMVFQVNPASETCKLHRVKILNLDPTRASVFRS